MKLLHIADLHLGKRVNNFSMWENQIDILTKIIRIVDEEKPDAVLIAGDVYDRSMPSEEAVELLDDFLVRLAQRELDVFIISGNHDSAERVAFGARLMDKSGIHISPVYGKDIQAITLSDEWGAVHFWLLPFIKPASVRRWYPDAGIVSYTDAMQTVVNHLKLNHAERNVALVHQFITGASVCDSEEHSVGGLDDISADVFTPFDYTALGHLHGAQFVKQENIRYSGSPLKYSFSEANHKKSVTIIELGNKGNTTIRTVELLPLYDMKRMRGTFEELTQGAVVEDFVEVTLTDEQDVPNAMTRLRNRFPNMMVLKYDNTRTRTEMNVTASENVQEKRPLELFNELYEMQNGKSMDEEQSAFLAELIEKIWGEME